MKISIAMATYNGARYLNQQIESILAQTTRPDEIIVCDDQSTDNTAEILDGYSRQSVLSYFVNESRLGVIDNFTRAVALTASENYVALSDQDDQWMPDKLEKLAAVMQETEVEGTPCMIYSDLLLVDKDDKILNKSFWNEVGQQERYQHNLQTLLFGQFVNGCTTLMNPALRSMFRNIPTNARFHHDDWIALAAFTFGHVKRIDEPLVRYRKHDTNVTIKANEKPRNRYRSILVQLAKALGGKDDFLELRFELARSFYNRYAIEMPARPKQIFEDFLKLEKASYFKKKLAFRRAVTKFRL